MNWFKRSETLEHYYRMGAQLASNGSWTLDEADHYAALIGLSELQRAHLLRGLFNHTPTHQTHAEGSHERTDLAHAQSDV